MNQNEPLLTQILKDPDIADNLSQSELKYYSRLDFERPVEVSGYYYDKHDPLKIHARHKQGCVYNGSTELNRTLLFQLTHSSLSVEFSNNIQSLHTDPLGEDMLTSWVDIDDLINCLYSSANAQELRETLKTWRQDGVEGVYLSWYENEQSKTQQALEDTLSEATRFWLQHGLLEIRSLALSAKNQSAAQLQDSLQKIFDIADASHSIPVHINEFRSVESLEQNIELIKGIIQQKNKHFIPE